MTDRLKLVIFDVDGTLAETAPAAEGGDMIRALADQIAADAQPLSALAEGEDAEVQTALGDADAEEGTDASEQVAAVARPILEREFTLQHLIAE